MDNDRFQEIKYMVREATVHEFNTSEDIWDIVNELIDALEEETKDND